MASVTKHYGQDFRLTATAWLSWFLGPLGFPDRAMNLAAEAMAYAEGTGNPHMLAWGYATRAILARAWRQPEINQGALNKGLAISAEQGYGYWGVFLSCHHGMKQVYEGHPERGIATIQDGVAALRQTGARLSCCLYYAGIAAGHLSLLRVPDGLRAADEGLALSEELDEHDHDAELHRLRGDLLLKASPADSDGAEKAYRKALGIAQAQSHRQYELRTATSLARLWQSQGKRQEAIALLTPVYHWFTEGFGTRDLKEAKALLDELISTF